MAGKPRNGGCKCYVNGQEITPEWLVANKGIKHSTAIHRIYEFNRGLIPVETLLAWGKANRCKGFSKATDEWKKLQDDRVRPLRCAPAGTWEREHIKDRGQVGKCRRGREKSPEWRETPAYYGGQFSISIGG